MSVIERIKEEMAKKGFSQNKLAKAAQMSQSGLSSILSGTVSPKENTLRAIAEALNVPLSELLDETTVSTAPWNPEEMTLTETEARLLAAFRSAEETYQNIALELLETHQKRSANVSAS